MELEQYIKFAIVLGTAVLTAYVVVKVAIAEIKRDLLHLRDIIDSDKEVKNKSEDSYAVTLNEVKGDVRAIFKTLSTIQVDLAKSTGHNDAYRNIVDGFEKVVNNLKEKK